MRMGRVLKPVSAGLAFAAAAALLAFPVARAQSFQPWVRVISPQDESYQSGEILIEAAVEPPDTEVQRVQFFGDGRLVCAVEAPPFRCAWNVGGEMHEHHIRIVAILPGGRRAAPGLVNTKGIPGYVESVNVEMIKVTAVVLDGTRFVRDLPRTAFRVYEDGVRQPIAFFGSLNVDLELVVGVDISESMTDAIGEMKEAVKRFLSALRPADRVTLMAFNENPFLLARPSMDLAARLAAVDKLAPWGATALHDVIIRSFETLGRQEARLGVVMFTDGDDTASRVSAEAVERRAESSDAVLYMIGQGRAVSSPKLKALCERLAQKSGGRAFFPRRIEELSGVFDQIGEELSNQYYFTYAPPSAKRDDAYHRIRVEVDGHYDVRARSGYRWEQKGQP
jgi:Ca-activated chloride channel family protein